MSLARALHWAPLIVAIALYAIAVGLGALVELPGGSADGPQGVFRAVFLAYAVVGMLIASRQPQNPIGRLLLAMAIIAELQGAASAARVAASVPSAALEAWAPLRDPWIMAPLLNLWVVSFTCIGLLLLLFPSGRLLSEWLRPVVALLAGVTVGIGLITSGSERTMLFPLIESAFAPDVAEALYDLGQGVSGVSLLLFLVVGAASMVVRLVRARGTERQQMKWLAYAGALLAVAFVGTAIAYFSPLRALDPAARNPAAMFGGLPVLLALVSVPISVGLAILRYRLYDIDLVINRTIVYAALTASLGATYVASVIATQALLGPITGGSEIAVAASTLLVVALFQPLRRRIQHTVDRRFYRARYDAQQTVDAFSARLRDEVDLSALEQELLAAIDRTLQPARASIWLRER